MTEIDFASLFRVALLGYADEILRAAGNRP